MKDDRLKNVKYEKNKILVKKYRLLMINALPIHKAIHKGKAKSITVGILPRLDRVRELMQKKPPSF
jgi:hypothetical protein